MAFDLILCCHVHNCRERYVKFGVDYDIYFGRYTRKGGGAFPPARPPVVLIIPSCNCGATWRDDAGDIYRRIHTAVSLAEELTVMLIVDGP